MGKFIFILGGARSGKSRYAVELAKTLGTKVTFIATAAALDKEMKERIKLHKLSRPRSWDVIEEGRKVSEVLTSSKLKGAGKVVLIDCLGLLISNFLADSLSDKGIEREINKLLEIITRSDFTIILVSNEVGGGIVPANALARRFRDLAGTSNQMAAKKADEVIFMQAGIPVKVKSLRQRRDFAAKRRKKSKVKNQKVGRERNAKFK